MRVYKVFWSEEDKAFVATCVDYPYLSGINETKDGALKDLKIVIEMAEEIEAEDNANNALGL